MLDAGAVEFGPTPPAQNIKSHSNSSQSLPPPPSGLCRESASLAITSSIRHPASSSRNVGSFLGTVEDFTHLPAGEGGHTVQASRMATDAEVCKTKALELCPGNKSASFSDQATGCAEMQRSVGAPTRQAVPHFFNLRRAHAWYETSPTTGWSRLPRHLPSSARLLLFLMKVREIRERQKCKARSLIATSL